MWEPTHVYLLSDPGGCSYILFTRSQSMSMSWGLDPWARRLAGSPHLTSPFRDRPGGIPSGWPGAWADNPRRGPRARPRTKDKETKDQGLYHNNRFLGDHIPGGGIDLRASGCALCVCLPLTLLYSYIPMDRPTSSHELGGRPGEQLLKRKPVEWIQPLRRCLLCTAFRRAQDRTTSKGQPR